MKIKLLDANVSNKIAAGEVVERPSSIVKELCENSIDAGATSITVEIKGGGIEYIRITDNGCGMEQDDVKTAFLPHATSKISVAEDLNNIGTLGFRGEALASIASVSRIKLLTRTVDSLEGTEINLTGGTVDKFVSCGCPEGTVIRVEDLFFNTPARRKFLKRPSQESSYINDVVNRLALSHPEVAVKFISEGKTVLRTPGDGLLSSCIRGIYGGDVAANIIPVSFSRQGITLSGFLGNREIQKSNRSRQMLFINGRSVKNDLISAAVYQGYAGRLNVGKFPFFVLNLTLAGNLVDVNVHPAKQEVRFADGLPVFDVVLDAVSNTLIKNQEIPSLFKEKHADPGATVRVADTAEKPDPEVNSKPDVAVFKSSEPAASAPEKTADAEASPVDKKFAVLKQTAHITAENNISASIGTANRIENKSFSEKNKSVPERKTPVNFEHKSAQSQIKANSQVREFADFLKASAQGMSDSPAVSVTDFKSNGNTDSYEASRDSLNVQEQNLELEFKPEYKIIGIIFDTYIIIEFEDSAYIIDQHAAHERILFERLYASCGENSASQIMMIPRIVNVSPSEQVILEDLLPHLNQLGYEIDIIGAGSFAVKATPSALEDTDPEKFITSLLTESNSIKVLRTNELKRNKLMQLACKSAVKAGDKLTDNDIKVLLELIVKENVPLSCPHGRPILIKLSKHELEVRFKRIQ